MSGDGKHAITVALVGTIALLGALNTGLGLTAKRKAGNEVGAFHLLRVIEKRRCLHTCERLQLDGVVCFTVKGIEESKIPLPFCSPRRDDAAEKMATWIEYNVPVDKESR